MDFCMNSRPLQPKRKKMKTQQSISSVFNSFGQARQSLQRFSDATPGKLRNSGVVKLEKFKNKTKAKPNLYPTHDLASSQFKFCFKQADVELEPIFAINIKKNLSCKSINDNGDSLNPLKQQKSKQKLKNYFKHLNLLAKNHSSFIGTSALLHKRQTRLRMGNKQCQEGNRGYRNGQQSLIIKASPRGSSDVHTGRSLKYQFCRNSNNKPSIGPWQGCIEVEGTGVLMPKAIVIKRNVLNGSHIKTS